MEGARMSQYVHEHANARVRTCAQHCARVDSASATWVAAKWVPGLPAVPPPACKGSHPGPLLLVRGDCRPPSHHPPS
eukprot:14207403-Alexandrium_andersonii.AAC.1